MHYISHNLKYYRVSNRFRQQEIADKIKVSLGMVKTYELGIAVPPIETLIKIADMMQITIDTLVKVQLTSKNYLQIKGQSAPDLLHRVEALEKIVNKTVNKISKKRQT